MVPCTASLGAASAQPHRALPRHTLRRPPCPLRPLSRHGWTAGQGQATCYAQLSPEALLPPALGAAAGGGQPGDAATDAAVLRQMLLQSRTTQHAAGGEHPVARPEPAGWSGAGSAARAEGEQQPQQLRRRQQQQQQHGGQPPDGSSPGWPPLDPKLARLARELVQARGAAQLRSALLGVELNNAEARVLVSVLGRLEAPDVALAVVRCGVAWARGVL